MLKLPIYQVDAFTSEAFGGNSAAVCLLNESLDDSLCQSIAMEMNLAETAFVMKEGSGFRLRWFTPEIEVDLCGHATLATAHVLWESGRLGSDLSASFQTRSGELQASKSGELIELNFPSQPPTPTDPPIGLLESLGTDAIYCGRNGADLLVQVGNREKLDALNPDFRALKKLDCRGIIVTCQSDGKPYDFVSRFFAPAVGIDEDPVTGSAHCCLTPFWAEKLGKESLNAFQASKRGGDVRVQLDGDRVLLAGSAVTVLEGSLRI